MKSVIIKICGLTQKKLFKDAGVANVNREKKM